MNEVIKKWVAALRSGEYGQGFGALRDGDKYCCLGVLCDLHRKETGGEWQVASDGDERGGFAYEGEVSFPPASVVKWSGLLFDASPEGIAELAGFDIPILQRCFTRMNDCLEYTFPEIADWIEANL